MSRMPTKLCKTYLNSYHSLVGSNLNYSKTLLWHNKRNFRKASYSHPAKENSSLTYKTLIYKSKVRLILIKLLTSRKKKKKTYKGLGRRVGCPQRKQITGIIL